MGCGAKSVISNQLSVIIRLLFTVYYLAILVKITIIQKYELALITDDDFRRTRTDSR
jgi:hypothetical protein